MFCLTNLNSRDYGCFPRKYPNENTISSQFAAKQQVLANELSNANVVR